MCETLIWLPIYTSAFILLGYSLDAWFLQPLQFYWLFIILDLVGFYGVGFVCSLLVGPRSAALLALVFNVIVCIMFSGTINAFGEASTGFQKYVVCWFIFWSTQGLVSEEYNQCRYNFDVDEWWYARQDERWFWKRLSSCRCRSWFRIWSYIKLESQCRGLHDDGLSMAFFGIVDS